MVNRLLTLLGVCCFLNAHAQNITPENKITLSTYQFLKTVDQSQMIPVLIKGDVQAIEQFVKEQGGMFKFNAGNIVSANLSVGSVKRLNNAPYVEVIDCPRGDLQKMNDVMVTQNNVDSAYYGYWPLDQGYDGTGVIIGIIDETFAPEHGDFNDAEGHTRIKYIWDQNLDAGIPPAPYDFGIECDSAMIENGTCPSGDFIPTDYSHGSGVTGVAASSGNATGHYRGVAPNADIIMVAVDFSDDFVANVIDAIAYVYEKATALNKPCVINTSLGLYAGSHDGKDLTAQTIDNLIAAQNRRVLVAAAGNAGNFAFHLGYDVSATEKFTWFKKLSYTNLVYFQLFADETEFNDVFFSIAADNPTGWGMIGETPDYNMLNDFDLDGGVIDSVVFNIPGGGAGTVYAQLMDGVYQLDFVITPANPAYYWRFSTHGTGTFDMWNAEATTGFSNYVTTGLPSAAVLPTIVNYQLPNTEQSIVSSWQCSDKVITVGSYVNRDSMTNIYGEMPTFFDIKGELFYSSSLGPTRDDRIKPDLCSTGARIISTASQTLIDFLIEEDAGIQVSFDGKHYLYNGTSFASPAVAGIAALYLQKNPDAGYAEVKNAIISNTRLDEFTGDALPDNAWGYGKADAFRTLTGPWGCSDEDHANPPQDVEALNIFPTKALIGWDLIPNAAGYQIVYQKTGEPSVKKKAFTNKKTLTGLTPNTEYICKVRAFCDGYGFSEFSEPLVFTTLPLKENAIAENALLIYPNPAQHVLYIDGMEGESLIEIYTMMGEKVMTQLSEEETIALQIISLPNGIYQVVISENGMTSSQKIIIAR